MTRAEQGETAGFGPRLAATRSRLAAVRPSQVVSAAAALATALLVGRLLLGLATTVQALVAGALLGAVLYTLASDRPPVQAVGAALLFPAGLVGALSLTALGDALAGGLAGAAVVYACVAAVGVVGLTATLAGARAPGEGSSKRAALRAAVVVVAPAVLFAAAVAPERATADALLDVLGDLLAAAVGHAFASPPDFGAFVFPALLAVTAWALWGALYRLPVVELVEPEDRERARAVLASVERACRYGILAGVLLLVAAFFLAVRARSPLLADVARLPAGGVYAAVAGSTLVRVPVALVLVGALAVRIGHRLVRALRRATVESLAQRLTPIAVGFIASATLARLLVAAGVVDRIVEAAESAVGAGDPLAGAPPFVVGVGLLLVVSWLATSWLFALVAAGRFALPPRSTGPALAGVACFALALLSVLVGRLLVGFVAAALALLAWDAGSYGGTMRAELSGRSGRTELVHVGGSLAVAAVAVGAAAALTVALGGAVASATVGTVVALALAGLSAFLLLSSL